MSQTDRNTIFVGQKSLTTYVIGAYSCIQKSGRVTVAARGSLIGKAILVAKRLADQLSVNVTTVASVVQLKSNIDGRERDVPTIELEMIKI